MLNQMRGQSIFAAERLLLFIFLINLKYTLSCSQINRIFRTSQDSILYVLWLLPRISKVNFACSSGLLIFMKKKNQKIEITRPAFPQGNCLEPDICCLKQRGGWGGRGGWVGTASSVHHKLTTAQEV